MEKLLDLAKQKNFDLEIFKVTTKSTSVEVMGQKVEAIENISETGISFKVIKNNKLGFAYTTDLDPEVMAESLGQALANSENTIEDAFFTVPDPLNYEPLVTFDRDISDLNIEKKIELALSIEAAAYTNNKIKKTEKVGFSTQESKIEILNSKGLNASYFANHCGGSCDVIAEEGSEQESGFSFNYTTNFRDFDPGSIGLEAATRGAELLGAKSVLSQKLSIILDPFVGAQLLGAISSLFSSEAVQKGRSLFAYKLGKTISSAKISIVDDGRLKNALFSAPIDDEGIPTQKTILVENGMLRNYLYNSYTAKKEGKRSTGNGKRPSYKSLPEVNPSNLYLLPGDLSPHALVSGLTKGIYITRVMGMHTINPISGEFSIGAAGIMVESGVKTFPVRGITIAGNLIDLLKSIDEIGTDLRFFPLSSNLGSPTLLVSDISISG